MFFYSLEQYRVTGEKHLLGWGSGGKRPSLQNKPTEVKLSVYSNRSCVLRSVTEGCCFSKSHKGALSKDVAQKTAWMTKIQKCVDCDEHLQKEPNTLSAHCASKELSTSLVAAFHLYKNTKTYLLN